jgi:hydroxymethylbilane synthase
MSVSPPSEPLRVGTRASALALRQVEIVLEALRADDPAIATEIVTIRTGGDDLSAGPQWRDDVPGFFTAEIEQSLVRGDVDLAVHSLKDLPVELWSETELAAVLPRADPRDVVVDRFHGGLSNLPTGARVGTSSLRRRAQALARRPDLQVVDLRGNIPTRVKRVEAGDLDAIVIAAAGLDRLGCADRISERLPLATWLPAAGQGAIAVQIRAHDRRLRERLARIDHAVTRWATTAERAFLSRLQGGCTAPVGAYARFNEAGRMRLDVLVADPEGRAVVRTCSEGDGSSDAAARELGRRLAERLVSDGARDLIGMGQSCE